MKIEYKYFDDNLLTDAESVPEFFMNDNPLAEVPEVKDKLLLEFEQTCKPHFISNNSNSNH